MTYLAESTSADDGTTTTVKSTSLLTNPEVLKGTVVSYKISGDKIIEKVTALSTKNAVVAYTDGGKYVGFQSTFGSSSELKLTSDSIIIRYSSEDVVGQAGNGITVAKESALSGVYLLNCYVVNDGDEVEALIIDKDNAVNAVAMNVVESPLVLTNGDDINGSKIGVPAATSAALVVADKAAIKTYVEGLFNNELAVSVNDNSTTCTTAVVVDQYGVATTYTLTMDGTNSLVAGSLAAATYATKASAETQLNTLKGNCTLSFDWTYLAGTDSALEDTDYVVVTATAPNGDVLATVTYTMN